MSYTPNKELRDLCIEAKAGDVDACRQVLKVWGHQGVAKEIVKGKLSKRAQTYVNLIIAGTDSHWEIANADGTYENLLMDEPPKPGEKARPFACDKINDY
jgi:hypothetical protein